MQDHIPLRVRYSTISGRAVRELNVSAGPLLEISLAQSRAEGVYVYRFDRRGGVLELVVWRGLRPSSANWCEIEIGATAGQWLRDLAGTALVEAAAWRDWRLEKLPEFVENRFETALVLPLIPSGRVAGMVTFARRSASAFGGQEAAFAESLHAPLAALMAGTFSRDEKARLETELRKVSDRLAGRKHVERAKGVLQARHGWTEEEAYLHLRQLSRSTRTPLSEVSRHLLADTLLRPPNAPDPCPAAAGAQ